MPLKREDQTRYRATMLLIAVGVAMPLVLLDSALGQRWPWKSLWLGASAATALWLRTRKKAPARPVQLLLASVMCALGPVSVSLGPHTVVELATIGAMPIIVAVLFIERFEIVVAVTLSGLIANLWLFWLVGWSASELWSVGARLAAGGLIAIASSWFNRRRRRLQRELDEEHQAALRASEARRAQAERLAMMGRLAAGVAHEINNPLAVISSNLNALEHHTQQREVLEPGDLADALSDAKESVNRISQIVADLKTWSRDDGQLEPTELAPLIASTVRLARLRMPRAVEVQVTVADDLPRALVHPRKLAQVLLNLLLNAGDALEDATSPRVHVSAEARDGQLVLEIEDNGPGLSELARSRLFEPFATTKPPGKGTGLGLALSREYVESFHGTLSHHDPPGGGACFRLTLPTSVE